MALKAVVGRLKCNGVAKMASGRLLNVIEVQIGRPFIHEVLTCQWDAPSVDRVALLILINACNNVDYEVWLVV